MDSPELEKPETSQLSRRPISSTDSAHTNDSASDTLHDDIPSPDPPRHALQIPELALTQYPSVISRPPLSRRVTTQGTTGTTEPSFEIDWEDNDPEDPRNWHVWWKALILFGISFGTFVVVIYSTSYTTGIGQLQKEFHVTEPIATLGVTTYLIGLAVGSILLAPISETYGRRPVYAISTFLFFISIIPCARATSMAEIIAVRFFSAVVGSAMIANAPGTVGDIIGEEYRAFAFSIWSIGPLNGPVFGPIIGGFITEYKGWRWCNWLVFIMAGCGFVLVSSMPETYSPVLLQRKATKMRKQSGELRYWSRYDVKLDFIHLMKVNLSRPFIMALTEPICIFWNLYIAIVYGILYLGFVAYPIVFEEIRGWSIGSTGLAFLGIGIGSMSTIATEPLIRQMINSHKIDPETGHVPPEASVSIVCVAACLIPIGELWFAWTCVPKTIHWAAPIAAGLPFGAGNTAVFIYASNYLVHSYGIYAASAMAGNSVVRSVMGATLPLAGQALYSKMGANWAGTFLGLLEVLIIPIPFAFYRYGAKIRTKSALIRNMREDQDRQEKKKARSEARAAEKAGLSSSSSTNEKNFERQAEARLTEVQGLEKEFQV